MFILLDEIFEKEGMGNMIRQPSGNKKNRAHISSSNTSQVTSQFASGSNRRSETSKSGNYRKPSMSEKTVSKDPEIMNKTAGMLRK